MRYSYLERNIFALKAFLEHLVLENKNHAFSIGLIVFTMVMSKVLSG